MLKVSTIADLRAAIEEWRGQGLRIAFVPTMGNLHAGHLQLVETAKAHGDKVVVSIFVNPMQFSDVQGGDFERYPRTLDADVEKLQALDVDVVFFPAVEEVYPHGYAQTTQVRVPGISGILCGEYRPGHFEGVATVVAKLFNMVQPHYAVFGEKDFQQLLVIRHMVADLCFPVEIIGAPTVREDDGLAMSSRNQYLTKEQRVLAGGLYKTLQETGVVIRKGEKDYKQLETKAIQALEEKGFKVEYFSLRDPQTLQPATEQTYNPILLTAAWLGETRLIDNLPV
jgi:pantoate--beta-alanine ligase